MAELKPGLMIKSISNPMALLARAILIASLFSGMMAFSVLADAPAEGIVVEGESVPGIQLGYTRAQVEAAYSAPRWCQDDEVGGDLAVCSYPVEDGSGVLVRFQGADGRYAKSSPDDTVYQIGWSARGWTTTAGVNITLALNDREAVAAAYPNAEVTYNDRGTITKVEDSQLGIVIRWIPSGYIFPDSVTMDIYIPPAILAAGSSLRVSEMDFTGEKIKSRRPVIVTVAIQDEQGQPVYGAEVVATWIYPGGALQTVRDVTSITGYAFFGLYDAGTSKWTLTIDDVLLDGHPFDRENSVLSISFDGKRLK